MSDEFNLNLINERIVEEQTTLIARARSKLNVVGTPECIDCGYSIPQARREAAPFATRCISCAERNERG